MAATIALAAPLVVVVAAVRYMEKRSDLKEGDIIIHNEANRERETELQPEKWIQNRFHPQHQLEFVYNTTHFWCDACSRRGIGNRYHCSKCDFDLHMACALSDDMIIGLFKTADLTTFAHEHPLELATGSEFTCKHCRNQGCAKFRYYCRPCDKNFHLMCATHPTRLSSFLHPQHELELKTRHTFKKCSVCRHGKDSNARVYTCEECEFYVHPECAVKGQYTKCLLHGDHTLVFGAVSRDETVICTACREKCKHWCYRCPVCKVAYFHPKCIDPERTGGKSMKQLLAEGFKEELANLMVGGVLTFVGGVVSAALGI